MADNRSLDEFLGAEPSEAETEPASTDEGPAAVEVAGSGVSEPESAVDAAATDEAEDVEPMAETFTWSTAGGECGTCGETVEERWRDGDDLVCPNCKAW